VALTCLLVAEAKTRKVDVMAIGIIAGHWRYAIARWLRHILSYACKTPFVDFNAVIRYTIVK
jgi:hypothetical protein